MGALNGAWQDAFFWTIGLGVATIGTINGWAITKLISLEREMERKVDRTEVPSRDYLERRFDELEKKLDKMNGNKPSG